MKRMMMAAVLAASAALQTAWVPTAEAQVSIHDIDVGEGYYLNRFFRENDLVYVRRIDKDRRRVKVQYARDGAVDWVSPSQLYSKSVARDADVAEGVVTAAVVVGGIWCILNPDECGDAIDQATKPQKTTTRTRPTTKATAATTKKSTKKTGGSSTAAVTVSSLPSSPLGGGSWTDGSQAWRDWAGTRLKGKIDANASVSRVRYQTLPFYKRDGQEVALTESTVGTARYYHLAVLGKTTNAFLDGSSKAVHEFNDSVKLRLRNSTEAAAYARFFCSSFTTEHGPFLVVEPDSSYLLPFTRTQLAPRPLRATWIGDKWKVTGSVIYASTMFHVTLHVTPDGTVDMVDDSPARNLKVLSRSVGNNGRHTVGGR